MHKFYCLGLMLFISPVTFSQEIFSLQGSVSTPEGFLENVFVLNKTTDDIIQVKPNGEFEIEVKIGDKLVVFDGYDNFIPYVFFITKSEENKIKNIQLIGKPEEMEELIVEANPTLESLGIAPQLFQKPNPAQTDIKKILLMFVGLFINKNKGFDPPGFFERKYWFEKQFSRELLTDKYNIPTEKADLFYRYLADDIALFNILQSNPKQTELELYEKSFRFLNTENNEHEE